LERHTDLAHEDQVERRLERRSDLRCDSNSTARQREDGRLLLLVSGKRNSKSPAGFEAVRKWHGVRYSEAESLFNMAIASCTVVINCAGKMMVEFFSVAISAI